MSAKYTIRRRLSFGRATGAGLFTALALSVALLVGGSLPAHAAPAKQTISRKIAKNLIAAQKALQGGKWDAGLQNLQAAEGKSGLTPFDHKTIDDLKAYAYVKLGNMNAAEKSWEAALQTGACTPQDTLRFTRAVFQLSYNAHDYAKAIAYGQKLIALGQGNEQIYAVIGQGYFLTKNCRGADVYMDKAIAAAHATGKPPQEGYYQIKLQCAFNAKDTAGEIAGFTDLVRLTNKPEYWNSLLRLERQNTRKDKNLLMIYRLMYNTSSMNVTSDYVEMAQLLGDAALPEEALAVVQKAISSGAVKPTQAARVNRLLKDMQRRAASDQKGIPTYVTQANKSPTGELDVKLGEVYYGIGNYANAVQAINNGLKKGHVKSLGQAYVYLGLSNQYLKNIPAAKHAFAKLKTVTSMPSNIRGLWALYAGNLK
ncbi:MAG: hypothetical protein HKM03_09725 [Steroidobacteraceae bacterium]|nr:hypothetical protein [Steroidobacteraceae bacterium]